MASAGSRWTVVILCAAALGSFAANSLLCRMALRGGEIDPATFTAVRLLSGALMLALVMTRRRSIPERWWKAGSWFSGSMLWLYAAAFSFAYIGLSAGTGALLLFGSVQATMIGVGLFRADQPKPTEWLGLIIGFAGLAWLVLPGLAAPPLSSAALMVLAGAAWGVYSLRGKASIADPVAATAGNFLRSAPMGVLLALPFLARAHPTSRGVLLALCSGAVTSGLGYVAWYAALKHLTGPRAAIVQLSVPVLAAAGGIVFLGETLTSRLVVSAFLVIGGVAMALTSRPATGKAS